MHSGSSINSSHPAISVSLGIASLVLEGRLISDEDFPNSDTEPPLFLERLNTVNDPVQDVHRIKQKLLQLRSCPGTSKDIVECPIAVETSITVTSADEHDTDDDLIYKNSFQQQPQIQVMQQQHQLQQQQQQQLQQHQQQQQQQQHDGTILDSLQFLATSCLKTTTTTPRLLKNKLNMGKNLATITTTEPTKLSNLDYSTFLMDFPLKFSQIGTTLKQQKKNEKRPKQGPHCEQFLKKFGVIKSEGADNIDELEHICNEAYNENCRRWNLNCTQIKSLINHGDPICIEVYLGPEINPILMEQWIIQLTNKPSHPTMNIQSLSSAIRSQLYFSQISSWTDLLKQQTTTIQTYNTEIKDNPRIKRKQKNNLLKSHLDILYRIKSYNPIIDLFTDKPLIHNFPDTIISDNLAIRVCLKSAPRFKEIPKLIDTYLMTTSSNSNNNNNNNNNNCPSSSSYGAGSSTSSSSSASSSASSSSSSMMIMDEHINMPCTEKGKHRCSYTNEQINEVMEIQLPTTQATLMQQQPITILSHREKQLIKYKKRLLKREKKKKVINNDNTTTNNDYFNINLNLNCCNDTITNYSSESINSIRPPLYTTTNINYKLLSPTTMLSSSSSSSTAVASSSSSSTSTIRPVGGRINGVGVGCGIGINGLLSPSSSLTLSIDTELYTKSTQTSNIDMMSVSTQTDNENINIINNYLYNNNYPKCNYCNNDMKCICWNCDKKLLLLNRNDKLLDNQERLLQSIQITPNYSIKNNNNNNNSNSNSINNNNCSKIINNNNNNKLEISRDRRNTCDLELKDCHLCKRQKTKHNTNTTTNTNINNKLIKKTKNDVILSPLSQQQQQLQISPQTPPTPPTPITTTTTSYRRTMSESLTGVCLDETKIQEQELTFDELKCFRRAFSEDVIDSFIDDDHDITCNSFVDDDVKNFQQKQKKKYQQEQKLQQQQRKRDNCVCRPNKLLFNDKQQQKIDEQFRTPVNRISYAGPIFVKCSDGGSGSSNSINGNNSGCSGSSNDNKNTKNHNYNGINLKSSIFNGRHIPKVNLTNIFNNGIPDEETEIEIFNFDNLSPNLINHNNTNIINNQNNHHNNPVQKSNSTPTLQNSSTLLSPRFLKSIALNKRRSRHLSERSSERSSIGSEEQLSDEEFGCGLDNTFSPVLSPNKICNTRSFGRSTVFGRLPLLGTLEESLLQRRFTPKFQVAGFKVLLGASGGFCPTQLTIPATTNLYELQGLTFTTPYVCEIRLPRKGYSIPPTGTVQTTLLNPQGTVVRMFVVPYDFRDMPNMSTTFIRQRILTYDESTNPTGKPLEQLSNAEQMKLLRYAIHLRFQRSRSGRLSLHTDIKLLISRRTDCDTAAAHAKAAAIESPNELKIVTIVPDNPKFSSRIDKIERKTIF